MAASLTAQTLSWGEITAVIPATTPPTYVVNVVLTSGSALTTLCQTTPSACLVGLQFDLGYTLANYTGNPVPLGLGASATTANADINTTTLPAANVPWITGAPATPNGPGQRAIIIGCCTTTQTTPTSNTITDGVVSTVTAQPTAVPTAAGVYTLTLLNLMGTSAGANNTAATAIPLTIGAGANDPKATGIVDLFETYLVGDSFPSTGDNLGSFGDGKVDVNDVVQVLFTVDSVPGYSVAKCTDRFDAMDSAPLDTATTRGGNGVVDVNDVVATLFRVDSVPGYLIHPVRVSLGENGVCPTGTPTAHSIPTTPTVQGTIVLGTVEPSGSGQERVPVYLRAGRDLARLAFTFGVGDLQSQLQFVAAPGLAPTLLGDRVKGVIVAAWLGGMNARAGDQVLLGYVVGPTGYAANLQVFGSSAAGLDDHEIVGLDVSGAPVVRR
jgi:hypothetical protein